MIGHPQRQYWLIWSSPYAQNADTFHGLRKFDVAADTIRNFCGYGSLCLWCKCFLVEFSIAPCPTRTWDWFNTRYPIPNPNLYFHVPNPPLTQISWYGLFLPLLDRYHCLKSCFTTGLVLCALQSWGDSPMLVFLLEKHNCKLIKISFTCLPKSSTR